MAKIISACGVKAASAIFALLKEAVLVLLIAAAQRGIQWLKEELAVHVRMHGAMLS